MKSSFLPEYEPNIVRISALCTVPYYTKYSAEILTIFGLYFGRNDDFINSFWNLLTFNRHTTSLFLTENQENDSFCFVSLTSMTLMGEKSKLIWYYQIRPQGFYFWSTADNSFWTKAFKRGPFKSAMNNLSCT